MFKRLTHKWAEWERRELERPRPVMEWFALHADRQHDRIRAAFWMTMVLWAPFPLGLWGVRPFHQLYAQAPEWVPVTLTVIMFPVALVYFTAIDASQPRFLRRARARRGLCEACGYDLRASPACCPECGQAREGTSVASGKGTSVASEE